VNIGKPDAPFVGKAAIELTGVKGEDALIIDPFIDASSKVLAVTGELNIYANTPGTVWTRLAEFADAGATTINVLDAVDWKVGDSIVIAPSGVIP
jgi:G8 domain